MRKNVLTGFAILLMTALAFAVQQGEGASRSVSGRVVNGQDQPLHKAVVHLKNTRTMAIQTYITDPSGAYRFTALSPNVDYELYAEYQGAHSDTKTVSAFSNRRQVTVNLKIKSAR
ncbi:MAG TPA: carboxypeptidase-like regulatory domain-containing protein [Candidatus Angelobacter sp.]|nr:carboxypeptidase-like regulatory domain-containing protein [Candidatus Angelobacter sp.]